MVEVGNKTPQLARVCQTDFVNWTTTTFPRSFGHSILIYPSLARSMAPQRRTHRPPHKLHCSVQGCQKEFRTKTGFTQHINARHRDLKSANLLPRTEPLPHSSVELDDYSSAPPSDDLDLPDAQHLSDCYDAGDWGTFGPTADSTERYSPPLASSRRTSPSPSDEGSSQRGFTEYHPLINGTSWTFHLYEVLTSVFR